MENGMERVKPLKEIKKEGKLEKITALISIVNLNQETVLAPSVLTYDIYYHISEKESEEESKDRRTTFIEEYKALCGYLLQNKYKYDDYIKGGLSLLTRDEFLKKIYEAKKVEEIEQILYEEYENTYKEEKATKCLVGRRKYFAIRVVLGVVSALLLVSVAYIVYDYFYQAKQNAAYISGYEAYIVKDYPLCIDKLTDVAIDNLDKTTKQILAVSYVKTDNLTQEQKDNITFDIMGADTEILYDYWIKLGRGMYEEAQNTAMQLADNEMLLYAYMKEAVFLKNDTQIDGVTKSQRLDSIEAQIEKLSKEYKLEDQNIQ